MIFELLAENGYRTSTTSTTINSGALVVGLLIGVALAFIPAMIASGKGYSFAGFLLFGFFCFLPALIVSLVLSNKTTNGSTRPSSYVPTSQPWQPMPPSMAPPPPPPSDAPPAGWYPDPGGSAQQRYWDGARWTEHLA